MPDSGSKLRVLHLLMNGLAHGSRKQRGGKRQIRTTRRVRITSVSSPENHRSCETVFYTMASALRVDLGVVVQNCGGAKVSIRYAWRQKSELVSVWRAVDKTALILCVLIL
jgi:hypothetical protein